MLEEGDNAGLSRAIEIGKGGGLDGRKDCTRRIVKPQQPAGMLPDKCKNGVPEEFLKEKKLI